MTRTGTPIHLCTKFLFNRLSAGGVEGGCKCLENHYLSSNLFLITRLSEIIKSSGLCAIHGGTSPTQMLDPMDPLLQNESRTRTTRATTEVHSLCETVDRASQ